MLGDFRSKQNMSISCAKIYYRSDHPALQLKKLLDWTQIYQVIRHYLQASGLNVSGKLRGKTTDVELYARLMVLMHVMRLDYRELETYTSENIIGRLFVEAKESDILQVRDHSSIARVCAAIGKDGMEHLNQLVVCHATALGFADPSIISADTTAQELHIGYPNEPGILKGMAQRCIRACGRLSKAGYNGFQRVKDIATKIIRKVKEHHIFIKGLENKKASLAFMCEETVRLLKECSKVRKKIGHATQAWAITGLNVMQEMEECGSKLIPQIYHWMKTGKVAAGKILHCVLNAYSIPRNKIGKDTEFGLKQLIIFIKGGYLLSKEVNRRKFSEFDMPAVAIETCQQVYGEDYMPNMLVFDRGGYSAENIKSLKNMGVKKIGIQPRGKARWLVQGKDREEVMKLRSRTEGVIGALKNFNGMNKPKERRRNTAAATTARSVLSFNLNKLTRDLMTERVAC
jgi:hypothetical protein